MKRTFIGWVAAVCAVGLLAGCGGTSESGGADGAVKIGVILSKTGPFSSIGVEELEGVNAAVEQLNKDGGVLGGKKIEVVVEDGQSTAQASAAAATKLIQNDKVVGIIGPEATDLALAAAPIAQTQQVPLVSTSSGFLSALPEKYLEFNFAASPLASKQLELYFAHWKAEGVTKVGIIGPKGELLDGLSGAIKGSGNVDVTGIEEFQPGQADISANLTNLVNSKPESIVVVAAAQDAASVQRTYKSLGLDIELMHLGSQATGAFIKLAGADSFTENTRFSAFPSTVYNTLPEDNPAKEAATAFVDTMAERVDGFDPGTNAVLSWTAVYTLAEAVDAAGDADPVKVRDALESIKFTTPMGVWQRSASDHDGSENPFVLATRNADGWAYVAE